MGTISHSPPINSQHLPTHPPALLPAQERNHISNLLRGTDPVRGAETRNHLEHRLWLILIEELSGNGARCDGVDADALAHEVFGHYADHLLDGAFGGAVEEIAGHDVGGGGDGGGEENDVGAGGHVGECFLFIATTEVSKR